MNVLQGGIVSTSPNPQAGGPPPCRLSTTAYSIYSQPPSILEVSRFIIDRNLGSDLSGTWY